MPQKETKQLIFQRDNLKKQNKNRLESLPGLTSREVILCRTRPQRTLPKGFWLSVARWPKRRPHRLAPLASTLSWGWVVIMEWENCASFLHQSLWICCWCRGLLVQSLPQPSAQLSCPFSLESCKQSSLHAPSHSSSSALRAQTWSQWPFWQLQITSILHRIQVPKHSQNQRPACLPCQEIAIRERQSTILQDSKGEKTQLTYREHIEVVAFFLLNLILHSELQIFHLHVALQDASLQQATVTAEKFSHFPGSCHHQ